MAIEAVVTRSDGSTERKRSKFFPTAVAVGNRVEAVLLPMHLLSWDVRVGGADEVEVTRSKIKKGKSETSHPCKATRLPVDTLLRPGQAMEIKTETYTLNVKNTGLFGRKK